APLERQSLPVSAHRPDPEPPRTETVPAGSDIRQTPVPAPVAMRVPGENNPRTSCRPRHVSLSGAGQDRGKHQPSWTAAWYHKLCLNPQLDDQRIGVWMIEANLHVGQTVFIGQQVALNCAHKLQQGIRKFKDQIIEIRQAKIRHMRETALTHIQHAFNILPNRVCIGFFIQMTTVGALQLPLTDPTQYTLSTPHRHPWLHS